MKIQPERLRRLRREKGLSRVRLAELSKVSERTIQRLENESERTQTSRKDTLKDLAKVLGVEEGVLTGDVPFSDANKPPEPERVQIGALVAPKARLAYDLIKRRYGVSTTEILNMAPLFFTLLAEGSLARRREKLEEAREAIGRLDELGEESGHPIFMGATTVALNADTAEEDSIAKVDIFGEQLFDESYTNLVDPFDPSTENPFAGHLRRLAAGLDRPSVVKVECGGLSYGAPWLRFPDYDLCDDELDDTTNGSPDAKRALETGFARLSDIPGELEGEARAAWLENKLPDIYRNVEGKPMAELVKFQSTATPKQFAELTAKLEEMSSCEGNHETQGGRSEQ